MITAGGIVGAARSGLPARFALVGPGMPGDDVTRALIFDAGRSCGVGDPIVRFYAEEMFALDWLRDYVMDEDLATLGHDLEDVFKVEEDLEEMYTKVDITQIQSDSGWADAS
jgi:hypothetical protein